MLKETTPLLAQNKFADAIALLERKAKEPALSDAAELLKQEKADVESVVELRRSAIEALRKQVGQQVTLKKGGAEFKGKVVGTTGVSPVDHGSTGVTPVVHGQDAHATLTLDMGGAQMTFSATMLSPEDVDQYAPRTGNAGADLRQRGIMYLAAGNAAKAKEYFTNPQTMNPESYIDRIAALVLGPEPGNAPPKTKAVTSPAVAPVVTSPIFPDTKAITSARAGEDKRPVPDADAQSAALKQVKDIFKEDYAKSKPEDRQALAKKLLAAAEQTKDDMTSRFVMCQEAADLAAKAGDARTALAALDLQAKNFSIDGLTLKAKALETASRMISTAESSKEFANCCLEFADDAIMEDNFAAAGKAVSLADTAARNAKELALMTQAQAKANEIRVLQSEFGKVKAAKETLLSKPDDPDANLAMGKYLCFAKGNWEKGLPLLAKSNDSALKILAEKEFAKPKDAIEQVALGDGWWDWAQKAGGTDKARAELRVIDWYLLASKVITGLVKMRISQRVDAIYAKLATSQTGNVALATNGTTVKGAGHGELLLDGKTTGYTGESGMAGSKPPCEWIITFPKPYLIRELRMLLWDGDSRYYNYAIETSLGGILYNQVVDRSEGEWRGWQIMPLDGSPIKYVKIKGLDCSFKNPINYAFLAVEFEAYCVPPERKPVKHQ